MAARHHEIPFYVADPRSTFDLSIADGAGIPIEERPSAEVQCDPSGDQVPGGVTCVNPAFDVTTRDLIAGFITEKGVFQPPFLPE